MTADKTVRVYRDTWEELHERKAAGETMDDVVSELLEVADDGEAEKELAEP